MPDRTNLKIDPVTETILFFKAKNPFSKPDIGVFINLRTLVKVFPPTPALINNPVSLINGLLTVKIANLATSKPIFNAPRAATVLTIVPVNTGFFCVHSAIFVAKEPTLPKTSLITGNKTEPNSTPR